MIKNIIAPVQAWLLSQARCVGCGMPIKNGKKISKGSKSLFKCKCLRIYVFEKEENRYRRAKIDEV